VDYEEVKVQLEATREHLKLAGAAYTGADAIDRILITIEHLTYVIEAFAAHVAAQATDGK
jgi:hypothetical protein